MNEQQMESRSAHEQLPEKRIKKRQRIKQIEQTIYSFCHQRRVIVNKTICKMAYTISYRHDEDNECLSKPD